MKESYRRFVSYSVWVAIILFVIRSLISFNEIGLLVKGGSWGALAYNVFGYAGEAIGLAFILMTVFNKFAWRWKIINRLADMPILAKEYNGTLTSDWKEECDSIEAKLEIKQTYLNVSIVLKTRESRSYSVASSIDTVCNTKRIVYVYQNEPKAEILDRSSIHHGSAALWIEGNGELNGNYYTDRKTRGSMSFKPLLKEINEKK